jgi:activator of HSP90 ATPase
MKTITQEYLISASLEEVWQALVNPKEINGWGAGPVVMDNNVGTKFSLWGGTIWGINTEVVSHKKLVQDWFSQEEPAWEKPSRVTFTLEDEKHAVKLTLVHTNIPDKNAKSIEEGWKEYYLGPLKEFLESQE